MNIQILFLLTLLSFPFSMLMGQACCSGGTPVAGNLGLGSGEKGSIQFQLTYDFNTLQTLMEGRRILVDDSRTRNTHSLLFESNFAFHQRWAASILLSGVRQERIIQTSNGEKNLTASQGIGDAIFLLKYNVLSSSPFTQLSLGAGPKFPLGGTDTRDASGLILPADLQAGTGAWDAIFWGYFSQKSWFRESLGFNLIPTIRLTGENARFNGRQSYRFGNEFQFLFGFSDRILLKSFLIDPMLMFRFRTVSADKVEGQTFPNTGGSWLFVAPGTTLNFSSRSTLRISAELPLYRKLSGTQITTTYRLNASLYYNFVIPKKIRLPISDPMVIPPSK